VEKAALMQQKHLRLFRALSPGERTNPVSLLKDAMNMLGYNAGIPRWPLSPGTEEEKAEVRKILVDMDIL
jgi:4-hydroxy-tetrahydrodipicolinate synthase